MSEKSFPDKKIKAQKVRIKQIDNCVSLLAFAKECGISTDCSAENIVDGDEKALMSFVYQIIIKYMKLDEEDEESAGMDVKQTLVLWLRNKLQGEAHFESKGRKKREKKRKEKKSQNSAYPPQDSTSRSMRRTFASLSRTEWPSAPSCTSSARGWSASQS